MVFGLWLPGNANMLYMFDLVVSFMKMLRFGDVSLWGMMGYILLSGAGFLVFWFFVDGISKR